MISDERFKKGNFVCGALLKDKKGAWYGGHAFAIKNGVVIDNANLYNTEYGKQACIICYFKLSADCKIPKSAVNERKTYQGKGR